MELIDWKMISVFFSVFQFIFMAVIFAVIKFNDLKHLNDDVRNLSKQQRDYETKQDERHFQNIKAINELAVQVGQIVGRCNAVQEIKNELKK